MKLNFSRPGKPTDNAFIKSFNRHLRQKCLSENWFLSLEDAREKAGIWRKDYDRERPHGVLGNLAPRELAMAGEAAN